MFKQFSCILVLISCLLLNASTTLGKQLLDDLSEAELITLAAGSCRATYSDRAATSLVNLQQYYSLDIEPFIIESKILNTNFFFAKRFNPINNTSFYILAFRGSENKQDWLLNFKTAQVPYGSTETPSELATESNLALVHKGFNEYTKLALAVTDSQDNKLTDLLLTDTTDPIVITGHSLGGAIATLYACRLLDLGVDPARIKVITFGAPEVGNAIFANNFKDRLNLLRITTSQDLIPISLNKFLGGYCNFGKHLEFKADPKKYSYADQHNMSFYFSESLKRFYDLQQQAFMTNLLVAPAKTQLEPDYPLVAIYNDYTPALRKIADYPYIQLLFNDQLRKFIPSYDFLNTTENQPTDDLYKLIPTISILAHDSQAKYLLINQLDTTLNSETEKRYLVFNYVLIDLATGRVLKTAVYSSSLNSENSILQTLIQISQSIPRVVENFTHN